MIETEKQWDAAAENYQAVFRLGLNDYNAALLRFWEEQGMLFPGCRVLDIGCGVGKYGTYLAELGYDVTLTDISGEMLRHARENMAPFRTPWAVYRCDFNEATGQEPAFAGGFDLSISTMSPAVHDVETVKKMSAMTRRWCFLARFRQWEQPFRDRLMAALGLEPRPAFCGLETEYTSLLHSVKAAGFDPVEKLVPYAWADRRTPEEMAAYMAKNYFAESEKEELVRKALRLCRDWADRDGTITDDVNTQVAWIYWKTNKAEEET